MMRYLALKIPPVALVLIAMGLMTITTYALPETTVPASLRWFLLLSGSMMGGAIALLGVLAFGRVQTTVHPQRPDDSSALVTDGIYRYTRNPMYVGFAIFLLGFAGFLGNFWALLWVSGFVMYLTQFQIKPEEAALAEKFPDDFTAYQQRTRRWL